jgi:hypothetical protein
MTQSSAENSISPIWGGFPFFTISIAITHFHIASIAIARMP